MIVIDMGYDSIKKQYILCKLDYLTFLLKIFLSILRTSHNRQLLSKGTKFQTRSFSFVFLFKLETYLYNSRPQNQMWLKLKMFLFCLTKILNQAFLHDSHIWLWCFFTFFFALAHSVAWKASCMVYYSPLSDHYYRVWPKPYFWH